MCHFDELREPAEETQRNSSRFVIEENSERDRREWPWAIRDTREKWVTAKCSNEATARTAADGLNRDDAARAARSRSVSEHPDSRGSEMVDSAEAAND
jgi:hypothetical protein